MKWNVLVITLYLDGAKQLINVALYFYQDC